jgi:hypothetical protein
MVTRRHKRPQHQPELLPHYKAIVDSQTTNVRADIASFNQIHHEEIDKGMLAKAVLLAFMRRYREEDAEERANQKSFLQLLEAMYLNMKLGRHRRHVREMQDEEFMYQEAKKVADHLHKVHVIEHKMTREDVGEVVQHLDDAIAKPALRHGH